MTAKTRRPGILISSPPWLIIGAAAILIPILIFMTYEGIRIQNELTTGLLLEKGNALIRSFEAGLRTGAGLNWGDFQVQKLLIETAQQPGIDYLVITDLQGRIVADSDPSQVGELYQIEEGEPPGKTAKYRRVARQDGADTFEIYRFFTPLDSAGETSWIIFVGQDMGPVLAVAKQNTTRLVVTALILVLIGFAGFASLVITQNYRAARSSLSRMKIFSDTLVENMPVGLVGIDAHGKVASINRAAEAILRLPAPEALGRRAGGILPRPCGQILDELASTRGVLHREMDYQAGDTAIALEVAATALEDENGTPQGYIFLLRDMTELKRLQREIERSQRLASIGSLAAGVAHEIRNPLSSIKGFAVYFKERYRTDSEDVKIADIMISEVERLNRVIGQLLDFSRPLVLKRSRLSLETPISHALRLIEKEADAKGVAIKTDLARAPEIDIDPDKMKQVFLNLFLNAIEAMQEGGVLKVSVDRIPGGKVEIAISDTGAGISGKDLARIFDPYFTTKPSGTGLGLAIVHKILEAHDGGIRFESRPGEGTTVTITLPV